MRCSGVVAPAIFARDSAIRPNTSCSCWAIPLVVSTRFGMRSLRRWSWFSTCAHWVLIASSWPTKVLYEHPEVATPAPTITIVIRTAPIGAIVIPLSPISPATLPAAAAAATAAAAAAEAAKSPAEPAAEATTAKPPEPAAARAAERTDAAVPGAPRRAAPVPGTPPAAPAQGVQHDEKHEQRQQQAAPTPGVAHVDPRCRTIGQLDPTAFRDPIHQPRDARYQALAVLALAKERHHVEAADLAGEAVGDELLQLVADLDPHLPVGDGHDHQQPVVLALLADAAAAVLEHLDRVLLQVGVVRLVGVHGGHHEGVAGAALEAQDHRFERPGAGAVDHVGKVVDRPGQLGRQRL